MLSSVVQYFISFYEHITLITHTALQLSILPLSSSLSGFSTSH